MDFFEIRNKYKYWYISSSLFRQETIVDGSFEVETKGKLGFSIDDRIVILDDSKFSFTGRIKNIIRSDDERHNELETIKIEIGELKEIEEQPTLANLAYSLTKVYKHFKRPYLHFKRRYGLLYRHDYNTIVNNKIFISRTALAKLFHSLPIEHQQSFVEELKITDSNIMYSQINNYEFLFQQLIDYIDTNIIRFIEMVTKSNSILKTELDVETKIGFADKDTSENNKIDYIEEQINQSDFKLENYIESLNFLKRSINTNILEDEYKWRRFDNVCLNTLFN